MGKFNRYYHLKFLNFSSYGLLLANLLLFLLGIFTIIFSHKDIILIILGVITLGVFVYIQFKEPGVKGILAEKRQLKELINHRFSLKNKKEISFQKILNKK